jgi:hypothetical protein
MKKLFRISIVSMVLLFSANFSLKAGLYEWGMSSFLSEYGYPDWQQALLNEVTNTSWVYNYCNLYSSAEGAWVLENYTGTIDNTCILIDFSSPSSKMAITFDVKVADFDEDLALIYQCNEYDQPELVAMITEDYSGTYIPKYFGPVYIRIIKKATSGEYCSNGQRKTGFSFYRN